MKKQKEINRLEVESSNLKSVGFDPESQMLEIEFHNGSVYQYTPVEIDTFNALMDAESKGSFFVRHIRNNANISYSKIGG